ncbi:MAG: imidazolonepropionase [Candidatus Eisenbacteria bacterium]|nr:imidazolonepropionase [Candidatus Eisenbacteria bacterium]
MVAHARQLVTLEPAGLRDRGGQASPRRGGEMSRLGIIEDGAVAVRRGRIVSVGPSERVLARSRLAAGGELLDASGRVVSPGFVDCHTHAVFAGQRAREFEMRLQGSSYMEIAARGGGILSSVSAFRKAGKGELLAQASKRLDTMLELGTTTVEIKSGYGLSVEDELKALEVVRELAGRHVMGIVPTFLGAHEVPAEFRGRKRDYVKSIVREQIPRVSGRKLAAFCDVFCEKGVFTVAESREILRAGMAHGLMPKVHAEEFARTGGAMLAAELGAVSADHLLRASPADVRALRDAGVVAVLLPGTSFSLGLGRYAPARAMIEAGLPVALATDCNPGSSMTESMQMMMTLACVEMRMTAAEALAAATVNSAFALALGAERGSLAAGKRADVVVFDAEDYREIPYHYGVSNVRHVVKDGGVVVRSGRLSA